MEWGTELLAEGKIKALGPCDPARKRRKNRRCDGFPVLSVWGATGGSPALEPSDIQDVGRDRGIELASVGADALMGENRDSL